MVKTPKLVKLSSDENYSKIFEVLTDLTKNRFYSRLSIISKI